MGRIFLAGLLAGRAKLSIRDPRECFGNRVLFRIYNCLFDTRTSARRGPLWQEQRGTTLRDRFGKSLKYVKSALGTLAKGRRRTEAGKGFQLREARERHGAENLYLWEIIQNNQLTGLARPQPSARCIDTARGSHETA